MNEAALEELSEDEKPYTSHTDKSSQKTKEATKKLVHFYDQFVEESITCMIAMSKKMEVNYQEVAQRLEAVANREQIPKEKFKPKMQQTLEPLNQLTDSHKQM